MIISMNATVCGDMTMVSDGSYKIICSDQHEATQVDQAEASSCGYKEIQEAVGKRCSFEERCHPPRR
jgi:hypothetical protein